MDEQSRREVEDPVCRDSNSSSVQGTGLALIRRADQGPTPSWVTLLVSDPAESKDLYEPNNPRHAEMKQKLREYKRRLVAGYRSSKSGLSESDEAKLLRGLGYIR